MCMQALSALFLGPYRAQAILEWEAMRDTGLLRVGGAVSLATGAFVAFAVSSTRAAGARGSRN